MLLIFDLDGTLFRAKPVVYRTAELFCDETGVPMPPEKMLYKSADTFLRAVLPEDADFYTARRRYDDILHGAVCETGELFPGVREMLQMLQNEGHTLTVCSASGAEYIRLALEITGISELFESYHSAEGTTKAEVIAHLTASRRAAAVIGDTHGDIEAAEANRLPCVAVMYGYGNRDMLSGADYFADSVGEIPRCIDEMGKKTTGSGK